jgi:Phospholipase B
MALSSLRRSSVVLSNDVARLFTSRWTFKPVQDLQRVADLVPKRAAPFFHGKLHKLAARWYPCPSQRNPRRFVCAGAADLNEILIGHSTWDTYSAALKIFKHYAFQLSWDRVAAQSVSFSSYPGELTSDDDLYMMSSGLVMVSTTNHIYNMTIFQLVEEHALVRIPGKRQNYHWIFCQLFRVLLIPVPS